MVETNYNVSDEEMPSLVVALDRMLSEEDEPDIYGILKECAWNILWENPGSEFGDWVNLLVEQYPAEVVDAFGPDPAGAYASLADLWETGDYTDEATGECHSFRDWAEYFATDRSVELYDMLAEARREISALKAR